MRERSRRRWKVPAISFARGKQAIVDTVYPRRCSGCGRRGAWVCAECDLALDRFAPPWCGRCGVPRDTGPCRGASLPSDLVALRSVGAYDGWLRGAIIAFKYEDERARADHLGAALADVVSTMNGVNGVVAVPLHPSRLRQRGYNQSALLVDRVGSALDLPVIAGLARLRRTAQQVGLGGRERNENVDGAFAFVADPRLVAGQRLLVVDDVLTTGSTMGACATALLGAGASAVVAATLAHEMPRDYDGSTLKRIATE